MAKNNKNWEILNSEYVIRRPWLTARKDKVRMPNGVVNNEHWVLEYPEWVNVIAITRDGRFVMEYQYRHIPYNLPLSDLSYVFIISRF